ncbi:MAG: hypothetical protein HY689_16455 [Chloroflexi bacterium]|nr:hypothetical protein [Chloroflexota bacterium]
MSAGAVVFIVLAGVLHLFAAPDHLDHAGHALFLVLAGIAEIAWGIAFWRKPSSTLYGVGIVLAGAFLLLWAITRVVPAPFGHGPGEVEVLGIASKIAEGVGLGGLLAIILIGAHIRTIPWSARRMILAPLTLAVVGAFVLYGAGLTAEWLFPWLRGGDHSGVERRGEAASAVGAGTVLPSGEELERLLTRSGIGPTPGTSVAVTYTPPWFFRSLGEEVPQASLERPTVIFFVQEENDDHHAGFGTPIPALLRLDQGEAIAPSESAVLSDDGHGYRSSRLLFPLASGMDPEHLSQEEHSLTLIMPLESGGESVFTWTLPLALPIEAAETASFDAPGQPSVAALSQRLTRGREGLAYGGKSGIKVEATYATPAYFRAALPVEAASRFLPDSFTVFVVSERLHTADLPAEPLVVSMSLDGREYQPDLSEPLAVSPHHRTTLVRFPAAPPPGLGHHVLELRLPGGERLTWHLPVSFAGAAALSGFQLTWVSILAILAGMVAAMWPCLFQLTVFFIPALAGLSMQEANGGVSLGRRFQVVKAAFFFVLGFTLVYTAGGALLGFAAQSLSDSADFYEYQRYAAMGGGLLIIILALRVAAKVRAPLVCKMPVLSGMAHGQKAANPVELMFAGLAFATGCMTCFGAAMITAMVVYVGLAGSVALGAMTMFLFSLGMGIPLVVAAIAMAKVLPVLFRLERIVPWMGLTSSVLMVGFGVLLITGNYMALTEWVYQILPLVGAG